MDTGMTVAEQWGAPDGETMRRRLNKALRSGEWKLVFHDRYVLGGGNENVYYVRPAGSLHRSHATRRAPIDGLAMVRRERVSRHECGATHAPLRVNDCQFALEFESANLRKTQRPQKRKSALRLLLVAFRELVYCPGLPMIQIELLVVLERVVKGVPFLLMSDRCQGHYCVPTNPNVGII